MPGMILLVILLASGDTDPLRHSVICAETGFSRAAESRNLSKFLGFLDEEARFVTGEVLRGPTEIGAAWSAFFADDGPEIRWRPAIVEVVADGTLAISRGPYRIQGRNADGEKVVSWGTFNSTWRRQSNGAWKVLFDAGGDHDREPSDDDRRVLAQEPDCN
ncbi:MAG TPA: DUF4440 domain-containing protein [Woeseiaceae bacterium]|nr:DUF4440 domain-containing protein [Woeseiaceae bacterium]